MPDPIRANPEPLGRDLTAKETPDARKLSAPQNGKLGGQTPDKELANALRTIRRMLQILDYAQDTTPEFAIGACIDRMREIRDMKDRLSEIKMTATLRP